MSSDRWRRVLFLLGRDGPCKPRYVAKIQKISTAAARMTLLRLYKMGLAKRELVCEERRGRPSYWYEISVAGEKYIEWFTQNPSRILSEYQPWEWHPLQERTEGIERNLHKMEKHERLALKAEKRGLHPLAVHHRAVADFAREVVIGIQREITKSKLKM